MDGRAWNSGYSVSVDGGRTQVWKRSIREVTRLFNEAGLTISASTVYAIQSQRDDRDRGESTIPVWSHVRSWLLLLRRRRRRCAVVLLCAAASARAPPVRNQYSSVSVHLRSTSCTSAAAPSGSTELQSLGCVSLI